MKNGPPKFVFAQSPTILVLIDGNPVWTPVAGTAFQRVLNSRAFIASDSLGNLYLHLLDGFVTSPSLSGPWTASVMAPTGLELAAQDLAKQGTVDLLRGQKDPKTGQYALLMAGVPGVVVSNVPTELVVTQGAPDWTPISGTQLLYVQNTTGNVFKDLYDQMTYVLVTGRWFRVARTLRDRGLREGEGPPGRLREDPGRQPEGEREGVRPRDGAGGGSGDLERDSAHGGHLPDEGQVHAEDERRAEDQADRRTRPLRTS